ncbi:MAG: excinuclease ABC subunit UvrC [Clostridiales bacterium]|nr:excinuclease ABC subunit UvrC [Clostridiales bacterium]
MRDNIAEKLKDLPDTPGVYIMRDVNGQVIYVGKAVVLKNRVRQYFRNTEKPVKVQAMVDNIADFDYIITRTEKDALALENNLIKKYKPHYNILLKDDKTSPYIRIDTRAEFPTIEVTRRVKRDGARYFGPFIGVSVRDVISILQSVYRLRTCSGKLAKRTRPCLNYDIDLCLAPCCDRCDKAEYQKAINGAMSFLSGGGDDISGVITQKMTEAAEKENFERAISYRNQLRVLENLKSKVVGELGNIVNIDAFYYTDNGIYGAVSVCIVRGGKMMGVKNYIINEPQMFDGDMTSFLPQYYSMTNELPDEICLQAERDVSSLVEYFMSVFSKRPIISFPQKGMRKKLLDTASRNCSDFLVKSADRVKRDEDMTLGACERLKSIFDLPSARRIECYDISNISGEDKVASGVVFIDGKADKAQYRRYRIRTVEGADDFRSMYETLTRRLIHYKNGDAGFNELPDLIVIDGGLEQVEFAARAADDVGVRVSMVGLAKRDEELYLRGNPVPIKLKRDDYALRLLQRVRDEAHRFAVLYHRSLRSRRYESELKGIDGVGTTTVKKVLEVFNTRSIVAASADEIAEKAGITKKAAKNIYEYYHPSEVNAGGLRYKLIAVDLDGTMLNDELQVSEVNRAAVEKFRAAGGIFTVATGRAPSGVARAVSALGLDSHPVKMVCHLGCMIVDSGTLEIEHARYIEKSTAIDLLRFAAPRCTVMQLYDAQGMKIESVNYITERYSTAVGITPDVVGDLSEYVRKSDEPIVKVILLLDEKNIANTISVLTSEFPSMRFIQSTAPLLSRLKTDGNDFEPAMIECISEGADKGSALKYVAEHYGIPMSEVMAFGDSFNDIPMIKAAGLGVAMGNAQEPVKRLADYVAETNNADGVAKTIEKFCFGGEGKGDSHA